MYAYSRLPRCAIPSVSMTLVCINASRKRRFAAGNETGRLGTAADLRAHLQGDGHPIPERHDRGDHPRVFRESLVVRPDGLSLLGTILLRDLALPEDIVRHQEAADPHALDARVEDRGIPGLVDVAEHEVERPPDILEAFPGVADEDLHFRSHAGFRVALAASSRCPPTLRHGH